jgi:hypothetical protein
LLAHDDDDDHDDACPPHRAQHDQSGQLIPNEPAVVVSPRSAGAKQLQEVRRGAWGARHY